MIEFLVVGFCALLPGDTLQPVKRLLSGIFPVLKLLGTQGAFTFSLQAKAD